MLNTGLFFEFFSPLPKVWIRQMKKKVTLKHYGKKSGGNSFPSDPRPAYSLTANF